MKNPFSLLQLKNTVAIKLTVWFLLLSLLPIAIIVLFVRGNITNQFINLAADDLSAHTKALSFELSTLGQYTTDTDMVRKLFLAYQENETRHFLADANASIILSDSNENITSSSTIDRLFSVNLTHQMLTESHGLILDIPNMQAVAFEKIQGKNQFIIAVRNLAPVYSAISVMEKRTFIQLIVSLFIVAIASGLVILLILKPEERRQKN
jgi:hypothetical protein